MRNTAKKDSDGDRGHAPHVTEINVHRQRHFCKRCKAVVEENGRVSRRDTHCRGNAYAFISLRVSGKALLIASFAIRGEAFFEELLSCLTSARHTERGKPSPCEVKRKEGQTKESR